VIQTFVTMRSPQSVTIRSLIRFPNPGAKRPLSYQVRHRPNKTIDGQIKGFRQASTVASPVTPLSNIFYGTALILGGGLLYLYVTDTRASIHRWLVVPALRALYGDAEEAHHAGNSALKFLWQFGLYPRERGNPDKVGDLQVEVFGYNLVNPIATSAGIDKDADIPNPLFAIGPSIVEVGGATPLPQDGNTKPRVFRLPSQNALINRYGLNSKGADHTAMLLRHRVREYAHAKRLGFDAEAEKYVLDGHANVPPGSLTPGRLLAVNIAKNKHTPDGDMDRVKKDYIYCVDQLGPYADILVVNVSSPNTPGLRSLQETKPLTDLLTGVVEAAQNVDRKKKPAVMVKVSPDEDSDEQVSGICQAVWESGVDGVIVGNTTKQRPDPLPAGYRLAPDEERVLLEQGGYSGPQLFGRTVSLVKKYRKLLDTRPAPAQKTDETSPASDKQIFEKPALSVLPEKVDGVQASVSSEKIDLKNPSDLPASEKQPLFQLPNEKYYQTASSEPATPEALTSTPEPTSTPTTSPTLLAKRDEPKVIFATGGITNGKQALDVLNAGASIAMVYTALVYFGVGTISRLKDELRTEIKKANASRRK
jgi:dihydroorotate dehydrogenase